MWAHKSLGGNKKTCNGAGGSESKSREDGVCRSGRRAWFLPSILSVPRGHVGHGQTGVLECLVF